MTAVQLRLKQAHAARAGRARARARRRRSPCRSWSTTVPTSRSPPGCGVHLGPTICRCAWRGGSSRRGSSSARRSARRRRPARPPGRTTGESDRGATTGTKADAGAGLGAARVHAVAASRGGPALHRDRGVWPEDVPLVLAAGGSGVAVVSGILACGRRGGDAARKLPASRPSPVARRHVATMLGVRLGEDVVAVRPGDEIEVGHLGGIERRLDAALTRGVDRPRRQPRMQVGVVGRGKVVVLLVQPRLPLAGRPGRWRTAPSDRPAAACRSGAGCGRPRRSSPARRRRAPRPRRSTRA